MRIAIVGAGAIGAFLGARLALAGEDVTLIARGAHLAAMREHGVRVRGDDGEYVAFPRCTDDLAAVSDADVALLTMKANALPAFAPRLGAALGPRTAVVTAQNGVPWWYFERHGGLLEGTRLRSVDPDGVIARAIPIERVIGCVVYPAAELIEPGVIWHVEGIRFPIGEPDGTRSERAQVLSATLTRAGLKAPVRPRIRDDIWLKLIGNAALNPLSALARATLDQIGSDVEARALALEAMTEAATVAAQLGVILEIGVEQRLEAAVRIRGHKPSMLADLEQGRPLELEPLVGAVLEIGALVGVELPRLQALYACAKLLDAIAHPEREQSPAAVPA
jgi:2-dehydropantoate 2-reductase